MPDHIYVGYVGFVFTAIIACKAKEKNKSTFFLYVVRNSCRGVFRTQSNICDGAFFAKNNSQKLLIIFVKKIPS